MPAQERPASPSVPRRTMVVRFPGDLPTLLADLTEAGFAIRYVRHIPGSRGRTADIRLTNGVVVSWDACSGNLWTEGPPKRSLRAERFLKNCYERHWLPRKAVLVHARLAARREAATQRLAFWLLRSDARAARFLRYQIEMSPDVVSLAAAFFRRKPTFPAEGPAPGVTYASHPPQPAQPNRLP